MTRIYTRTDPATLFWARVDKRDGDGCWLWTSDEREGYGLFSELTDDGLRRTMAHRWSYEQEKGPIPNGLVLDHLCRVALCVRPDHLEPVTQRTNILRGFSPAAIAIRTNRCSRGHEFTPENTYWRPKRNGFPGRQCKACRRMRERGYRRG